MQSMAQAVKISLFNLPGTGTSHTKAFVSKQRLSAHPGMLFSFACTMQFSDMPPLGSSCNHSEKGIVDPSIQT